MASTGKTSSSSSVSSSLSAYTGMGGLISGMDTDSLVEKLTSVTRGKISKAEQNKQKTQWEQGLYQDIIKKLQDFSNTYFSYASKTNILSANFFKASSITSSSSLVSAE
ncbi:MAG: flagellar cap protein FliD N-terminal domain-containing protein, partial [Bacillota bacterium]|nr:flagellar cap protein FliD N-terminal domain-containing protein [Bacillota bacterium]